MRKRLHNQEGQVLVEYVLMLSMAIGVLILINNGFRKPLFRLWASFARDISAACPSGTSPPGQGCPSDPRIRFR